MFISDEEARIILNWWSFVEIYGPETDELGLLEKLRACANG